ncbi:MAG: hypothetical protein DWQ37_06145 [Planctomycetota bacterium]|nr:MAG: hypothetical protein DWQ37_06145 [Planctomycetota bacterium]
MGSKKPQKIDVQVLRIKTRDGGIYKHGFVDNIRTERLSADDPDLKSPTPKEETERALEIARRFAAEIAEPFLRPTNRPEESLDEVAYDNAKRGLFWHEQGLHNEVIAVRMGEQYATFVDVGGGPRWYAFELKPPGQVVRAIAALRALEHVYAGGVDVALHAMRLGRLCEQLRVLPHEPAAKRGKKWSQQGRNAGKTSQVLTDEQREQVAQEIHELVAGGMKLQPACKSLEKKGVASLSTLKRAYKKWLEAEKNGGQAFD